MKNPIRIIALLTGLMCTNASAQVVGSKVQPISGSLNFENCSATAEKNIRGATAFVLNRLNSPEYLICLQNANMTETLGDTPEQILGGLLDPFPTSIRCEDVVCNSESALGCADIDLEDREEFLLANRLVDPDPEILNSPQVRIAQTFTHEVAHNKRYVHPDIFAKNFSTTVPETVEACMGSEFTNEWNKSKAKHEVVMAPVGGTGGVPFITRCNAGEFVSGIAVKSTSTINSLQLYCEGIIQRPFGRGPGQEKAVECQDDEIINGVFLQSDETLGSEGIVNYLAVRCEQKKPDPIFKSKASEWQYIAGAGGGIGSQRNCPDSMGLIGFAGRAGDSIDSLRPICASPEEKAQSASQPAFLLGTRSGYSKLELCQDTGVVNTLYGRVNNGLFRLGGSCEILGPGNSDQEVVFDPMPDNFGNTGNEYILDWNGGGDCVSDEQDPCASDFTIKCPIGEAAIGIDVRGATLRNIRATCADPQQWNSNGTQAVVSETDWAQSSSAGQVIQRRCPLGSFLVGFQTWSESLEEGSAVNGFMAHCRAFDFGERRFQTVPDFEIPGAIQGN